MDPEGFVLGPRAKRAIPLVAVALTIIVVGGLLYLRPPAPAHLFIGSAPVSQLRGYRADYDFDSPTDGWALVDACCGRFWVYHTTDGARHWAHTSTITTFDQGLSSMHFFDSSHGFIQTGRAYSTSDAGVHWTVISVPDNTSSFTFASPSHGWAIDGTGVFATVDGGLAWQMRGAVPSSVAFGGYGKGGFGGLVGLDFRADGEGWLGGAGVKPLVYSTRDGGVSWLEHAVPFVQQNPVIGGKPYFVGTSVRLLPGHAVIVFASDAFGNLEASMSTDGGSSWEPVRLPWDQQPFASYSFLDDRHWWASDRSLFYTTADAGRTWREVHTVVSDEISDWSFGSGQMIDSRHGWTVITSPPPGLSGSGLSMTSDGIHWGPATVPQPPKP